MATYDVVLLVEQALSAADAQQISSLHSELREEGEQVAYHVLLPADDAAARVEAAMGGVTGGDVLASPAALLPELDLQEIEEEARKRSEEALAASVAALTAQGVEATGALATTSPIDALVEQVRAVDAREAIVLTRPHLVSELFHLDWTSQARRKLDLPVLHLLEHETIDEQSAGGGEGASLI
ncbi:hypothetical protein [Nocardioides acrostichi]|uniref:Universal stress protein n=1 Tax=Nocardioides acrostichi TaxID=2784339 RepID=A0A930YB86_9ACTN|nr:hypothetical protein [Nocardioides acrostichi]MBF4160239.1 hypothetical protein [Nocardioides acrostichi]